MTLDDWIGIGVDVVALSILGSTAVMLRWLFRDVRTRGTWKSWKK